MTKPASNIQIGQTKSTGYEFGIRRTFHISPEAAWGFLLSQQGLRIWLGKLESLPTAIGTEYCTAEGVRGKIRAGKPGSHLRMDWQTADAATPVILQVRVIPNGDNSVLSFHLERLADADQRAEMDRRWSEVMRKIAEYLG